MIAFHTGYQDGGASFNEGSVGGGIQAGAVNLNLAGRPQRSDRDALHADPVIRLGIAGGRFRFLQHQRTFAEPAVEGTPVGNEERDADQHSHSREGQQRRADAEELPAAIDGGELQQQTADARNAETGHEGFQDNQSGAEHEADDHDEIQRELIHTGASFPFISLTLLYTFSACYYMTKSEK